MSLNLKERVVAFAVHLAASVLVGMTVFGLIWLVWYPPPLLQALGILNIFFILLMVDVVAGPTLTFLVFNRAKKSLKFDLLVIVLLQLGALVYGLNTVYQGRPVYVVFNIDRFSVVSAADLVYVTGEDVPVSAYLDFPKWGPEIIGAKRPETSEERSQLLFSSVSGGRDLDRRVDYYVPVESLADEIKKRLRPLDELPGENGGSSAAVDRALDNLKASAGDIGYLPVVGRNRNCIALVDRSTAKVLKLLLLEPSWKPLSVNS